MLDGERDPTGSDDRRIYEDQQVSGHRSWSSRHVRQFLWGFDANAYTPSESPALRVEGADRGQQLYTPS